MATIIDEAKAYEPKRTLNIADLESVDVNLVIEDKEGIDAEGKTFKYKALVQNGQEYRVPVSVLDELKKALKIKPDIKRIRVNKQGSNLNTKYSIEVLE